jgi:nucleotide-binding universal stress UspA family protein
MEASMKRILVPVDGSDASLDAVRIAVREAALAPTLLELVNVQPRWHRHVADRVPARWRRAWRAERARTMLAPAERIASDSRIDFRSHALVGPVAPRLLWAARTLGADEIVIGAARRGPFGRWLANSVSSRLLEVSPVPVRVVPGAPAPLLERIALPAGLGLVALLLLADE